MPKNRYRHLLLCLQVHSHLNYAIGVWGPMIDIKSLKKIASLQKQCVLLVDTKINRKVVCEKLRILTVQQLISLEQCKLGYKLCHSLLPISLERLMKHDHNQHSIVKVYNYQTRQKDIPYRPNVKSKSYRNSFFYRSIYEYSEIPSNLRNIVHLKLFANKCKEHFLTKR